MSNLSTVLKLIDLFIVLALIMKKMMWRSNRQDRLLCHERGTQQNPPTFICASVDNEIRINLVKFKLCAAAK